MHIDWTSVVNGTVGWQTVDAFAWHWWSDGTPFFSLHPLFDAANAPSALEEPLGGPSPMTGDVVCEVKQYMASTALCQPQILVLHTA